MPDDPNRSATPNNGVPPPTSPPASSETRPSWLPEGFDKPEDLASRWVETDKRLKELEPKLKVAERWERWGDPDQFEKALATRLIQREQQMRAQWEAEQKRQQAAAQQQDPFEGWEMLEPRAQAAALLNNVLQNALPELRKEIEGYWNQGRSQLSEFDQRFQLLARALTDRTSNPDLDLNQLWSEANSLATGDPNQLYNLAYERATAAQRLKKEVEAAVAAERQKLEQEYKNKLQASLTGPGGGASAVSFKDVINQHKSGTGKDAVRQRVLQKFLSEGQLVPGQI